MNGRIYDYNVGRFLGVDPFLQFPTNSQSANPYTYILNNPMSGTDPSGYIAEDVTGTKWANDKANNESSCYQSKLSCEWDSSMASVLGVSRNEITNEYTKKAMARNGQKNESKGSNLKNISDSGSIQDDSWSLLDLLENSLFTTADALLTTLAGSTLPETPEEYAALAERGNEIIRLGHTGKGNELSYAEAWYLYKNAPKGFELTVDGRVIGDIGGVMATPFPLDSLKVHGHITINAQGRIEPGRYDFDPGVMLNPDKNLRIAIRNNLNKIAIRQHGAGNAFLIKYSYDDEDFK